MLPKYFEHLHLYNCAITGKPRIVNTSNVKDNRTDKYIEVPKEEFESAIIHYFQAFPEKTRQLFVLDDWSFFIGGNPTSKEDLIKILEGVIEEVKGLGE